MEIKEVVTYYLNTDSNILEVTFRTIEDTEDSLRTDYIDYTIVNDYGYDLESESFDFFGTDSDDDDDIFGDEIELDDEKLISFLNEYYLVNQNSLPKPELY
jgi:hypothetical protein